MLGAVRVEAAGFGTQDIRPGPERDSRFRDSRFRDTESPDVAVLLAPVGRIVGRLVAPGDEPIRGVTVRATTLVGGYAGSGQRGSATVACDPQGRFEIPAIAAGMLTLELQFDPAKGLPLRGEAPKHLIAKAGQSTEMTIPLRETVKVRRAACARRSRAGRSRA